MYKSNKIIIQKLSQTNHQILSEETEDDLKRLEEDTVWIIDPLDGTKAFINKNSDFSIMIALVKKTVPILGIVYQPISNALFIAQKGQGAYKQVGDNWVRLVVSQERKIENFTTILSYHHLKEERFHLYNFLKENNILKKTKYTFFSQFTKSEIENAFGSSDGLPTRGDMNDVKCPKCQYSWKTRSTHLWVTCPNCMGKFEVDKK